MTAVAFFVGASALVSWLLARRLVGLRIPQLLHRNHRGEQLPVVLGLSLNAASAGVLFGAIASSAIAGGWGEDAARLGILTVLVAGVGAIGFLDDLSGGAAKGWRGHLGAAGAGRMTTGLLKVVAIGILGLGTAGVLLPWTWDPASLGLLAAATVAIAGSANVANGLDVAPGRVGKWFLVVAIPVAVSVQPGPAWTVLIVVIGAELGLLGFDLRERAMLGDAGSNVLGFVVAAALVPALEAWAVVVVAAVVVGLNLVAEMVTFSRVIDAVAPLRWFDRLGRKPS